MLDIPIKTILKQAKLASPCNIFAPSLFFSCLVNNIPFFLFPFNSILLLLDLTAKIVLLMYEYSIDIALQLQHGCHIFLFESLKMVDVF